MSDFDGKFNYPDTTPYERRLYGLNKDLENRIDKAIKYISEYRNGWSNWFEFTIDDKLKLLDILKGSDKE